MTGNDDINGVTRTGDRLATLMNIHRQVTWPALTN